MNTKSMLINKIHAYDFAILEIELFLDTHPQNTKALARREAFIKERDMLVREYESKYGEFVVTKRNVHSLKNWSWVNNPWPWEFKESEF